MAYLHSIQCDGCNAIHQIPQPGAVPNGWIIVGYVKQSLNGKAAMIQQEPVNMTFCSWRCVIKHAKGFVQEVDKVVKA